MAGGFRGRETWAKKRAFGGLKGSRDRSSWNFTRILSQFTRKLPEIAYAILPSGGLRSVATPLSIPYHVKRLEWIEKPT